MEKFATLFVVLAAISQAVGFIGFRRNIWNFKVYIYGFTILTIGFLSLIVSPIYFPGAPIFKQLYVAFICTFVTLLIAIITIKYFHINP